MPRPQRRIPAWRFWTWAFVGYVALLRSVAASPQTAERQFEVPSIAPGPCEIIEVQSGNTLLVHALGSDAPVVVRLLSAQAATVEQDGSEHTAAATRFSRDFVAQGQTYLRLDNHRLDTQGNYLAYLEVDGELLNLALIEAGLARFYYFPGNSGSIDRRLKNAEEEARIARRGIWRAK